MLDDQDRIREYNESAREIFPKFKAESPVGRFLEEALSELAEVIDSESSIVEKEVEGETLYY